VRWLGALGSASAVPADQRLRDRAAAAAPPCIACGNIVARRRPINRIASLLGQ